MLKYVTIPGNVAFIGFAAFSNCSLRKITIPNSVVSIGECAFSDCYLVKEIILADSVEKIGARAFNGCCVQHVLLPKNITSLGECVFDDRDKKPFLQYNEDDGLLYLGDESNPYLCLMREMYTQYKDYADYKRRRITNARINKNCRVIADSVFDSLESIVIPKSITKINLKTFEDCSDLSLIKYDGTVAEWNAIKKEGGWKDDLNDCTIVCLDGKLDKKGNVVS